MSSVYGEGSEMAPVSLFFWSTACNSYMAELKQMCFVLAFLCCAVLEATGSMFSFSPSESPFFQHTPQCSHLYS